MRIAALAVMMFFSSAVFAQRGGASAPSVPHNPKDLSGVWLGSGSAGGGGNAVSQWAADLPFSAKGRETMNANKSGKGPRAVIPALGNDPLGDANPPGLLRTFVYGRPIEIVQTNDRVIQLFEWAHFWRDIYADGRPVNEDAGPYWYGYSVGKWEGDTFVVETRGLDNRAWLDEWGTPFGAAAKVTERWRRIDRDNLELTITVDDPEMYTRTWTSGKRMFRLQPKGSENGEILEVIFAPMDEQEFNRRIRNPAGGVESK